VLFAVHVRDLSCIRLKHSLSGRTSKGEELIREPTTGPTTPGVGPPLFKANFSAQESERKFVHVKSKE
jgi:hypothetical protein